MKTTLAEIDSVCSEIENKILSRKALPVSVEKKINEAGTISIAGFPVYDAKKKAAASSKYLEQAIEYALARSKLITDLDGIGVKVLASLPVEDWNQLCKQTELLQFYPQDGRVYFDVDAARTAYKGKASVHAVLGCFGFMAAAGALALALGGGLIAVPLTVGGAGIIYGAVESESDKQTLMWFKHLVRNFGLSYHDINQFVRYDDNVGVGVNLVLPPPPADVNAILLKLHKSKEFKSKLRVAAVADAVRFDPPLRTELVDFNKTQTVHEISLRQDPIVYIDRDGVTAIVAQFGDFPIEKATLDALIKNEVVERPY